MKKIISALTLLSLLNIQITFQTNVLKVQVAQAIAADTANNNVKSKSKSEELETAKGGDFMNIITMMLMGYILSRQVIMCKPVPTDVMVAAGAGIVYVGGEIYALNAYKKMQEDKIDYVVTEDGSANKDQVEYLNKQKESYQEVVKTAKTKKMVQLAATVGLGAAAVMAYMLDTSETVTASYCATCGPGTASLVATYESSKIIPKLSTIEFTKTEGNWAAIEASCTSENAAFYGTRSDALAACVKGGAEVLANTMACAPVPVTPTGMFNNSLDSQFIANNFTDDFFKDVLQELKSEGMDEEIASNYLDQFQSLNLLSEIAPIKIKESATQKKQTEEYFVSRDLERYFAGEVIGHSVDDYKKYQENLKEVALPEKEKISFIRFAAEKGLDLISPSANASLMGFGAATMAIVAAMFVPLNTYTDMYMAHPFTRAIIYGVLTGMAYMSTRSIDNVIEKAEGNIEKIDSIIKRLSAYGKADKTDGAYKMLTQGTYKPFDKGRSVNISDGNAKMSCVVEGSRPGLCGSLSEAIKSSSSFATLPSNFATTVGTVGDVADGVQGSSTLSSGTLSSMDSLANQNNAMGKLLKEQKKKLSERLAKQGSAINPDDMSAKLRAKMRKAVEDGLKKKGMSAEGFLASAGIAAPTEVQKEKAQEVAAVNAEALKNAGIVNAASKAAGANDFKFSDLDSGSSDDNMAENESAIAALNESRESQDDIIKNKDVSIFKVISTRYLKSGYPRLLEEIKK